MLGISSSGLRARLTVNGDQVAVALPLVVAAVGIAGLFVLDGVHPGGHLHPGGHVRHVEMALAMTLAMMSPMAVPLCRVVARATLWWQAPRTVLVALAAYLCVWCLASMVLHIGSALVMPGLTILGATVCLTSWCVALQILPGRARVLAACAVTRPVRPGRGMRDATGWGVRAAGRCVTSCLVPMALTAVHPTPAAVGGVGALLLVERFSEPLPRGTLVVPYIALGAVLISSTLS
jgi:Predicted metal-binding integral membrane protein (DUF2182)